MWPLGRLIGAPARFGCQMVADLCQPVGHVCGGRRVISFVIREKVGGRRQKVGPAQAHPGAHTLAGRFAGVIGAGTAAHRFVPGRRTQDGGRLYQFFRIAESSGLAGQNLGVHFSVVAATVAIRWPHGKSQE